MKRSKRLTILLVVLAVACIATFAAMHTEERKEQIKTSGEIVLEVASADVQSLSWEHGGSILSFHREETWLYDEDEAFPVDEEKINELLEPFASFGVSFVIEEVADFGMYGLDDPVCTIQLETAEQSYEIALGDFSNMDSERYVSIGDGNVYLAKNDPLDQYDAALDDLLRHDENLSYDQVTRIQFQGTENYTISYEEEGNSLCDEDVYFTEQSGKKVPLDTDRVGYYLEGLVSVELEDFKTYKATEEELASYGLNQPELIITVDYTVAGEDKKEQAGTYVLSISRDPEELAALEKAGGEKSEADENEEEKEITAYARVGDSPIVYQLDSVDYIALMAASYDSLRHRQVLTAEFEDVYQVDISLEGSDYSFVTDGKGKDDEPVWKYQEEEIEIDSFQKELYSLSVNAPEDFTTETPSGKEEISLTLYMDNERCPQIRIALYRYDGSDCLALVDGKAFALIPRADAVDLIEEVNAIVLNGA